VSQDAIVDSPTAHQSPFRVPAASGLRQTQARHSGQINLKSCGLLHPRAAQFHVDTLRTIDPIEILTYPVFEPTYVLLADWLRTARASLVLTAGSDPGLSLLVRAFPPARRIVIHMPNFGGWHKFARIADCTLNIVGPNPASGVFDVADLLSELRKGPPAFVVVTQPHSYTGQVHNAEEINTLAHGVAEHGSLLVLDTCYLAFVERGEDLVRGVVGQPHVVRVNGFSKCFGLSGARIAVIAAHPDTASHLLRLDPERPVTGVATSLLCAALRKRDVFESIWVEIRHLRGAFAGLVEKALPGWRARPSGANFVTFDVPDPGQAASATTYLMDHGFITRDLSGLPSLPAAVRIAVADEPTMRHVVRLLTLWREQ